MAMNSVFVSVISMCSVLASVQAFAAAADDSSIDRSESNVSHSSERHFLLDPVELAPVTGLTVINSHAGYNVGVNAAYPLMARTPLYLEPSFIAGIFSDTTQFNLTAAARYDISLPDTNLRAFARAGVGPTFQTTGTTVVFNASFGGGVLYPVNSSLSLRGEASLVDIDGNAGIQITGGISL